MSRYSREIRELIKDEIKDMIHDYEGTYICDLAHEMYNKDYYIIGTYQAKEFLKKHFDDMCECIEAYEEEFGEQYPYITNSECLATLLALQVANEIFNESKALEKVWGDTLEEEHINEFIKEL